MPPLISNVKGSFEITEIRDLVSITTGAVVTIPRGVAVRIKCIATGIPSPNITWYRKGENTKEKSLLVPNENMKIMKDYSLHISHTLVVDAAYYTCVATNIAGQDEGTTHLNIGSKGPLVFCILPETSRLCLVHFSRRFNLPTIIPTKQMIIVPNYRLDLANKMID